MKKWLICMYILFTCIHAYATHERAGEIIYKHISGLTYQITLITYTYTPSPADRDELEVLWGDGTSDIIKRTSKTNLGNDVQQNVYIGNHTYPAMGSYIISMEDPNRNQGIVNVPYSIDVPFYIESELIINPFFTFNNSPILTNPPIDVGCVGKPFYHNPGAVDLDGDSLVFSLVKCKGYNGQDIPGYTLPLTSNGIGIDAVTGDFYWDCPILQGEYNIAILIEEFRYGVKVGSLTRDMQIIIMACDNNPPEIITIEDTCVNAGDTLVFKVLAKDPDFAQVVTLTATSPIFQFTDSLAYFDQPVTGRDSVYAYFSWATNCDHVRNQAYPIVFKAQDNGAPVSLVRFKTIRIKVVAPAPKNVQAFPFEKTILLSWDSSCSNAAGYKIYRREGVSGFVPQHCETGVPEYTGYKRIGEVKSSHITSFVDDNKGFGLKHGIEYCYLIIAYYDDNAESYASREICAILKNYLPIITHVSIEKTDTQSGKVLIKWELPDDIDTIQYPGPYSLGIKRDVDTFANVITIHAFSSLTDTSFIDSLQNTESHKFYYILALYNHTNDPPVLIDYSDPASSIFMDIDFTDKALILKWKEDVPWHNTMYEIFRYNKTTFQFDSIGSTAEQMYVDEFLNNGENYCYYVQSVGHYDDTNVVRPLLNKSQIKCGVPIDNVSPCTPILFGETDCIDIDLRWELPFDSCFEDVIKYYIYYTNNINSDYTLIDSITDCYVSNYKLIKPKSIVGCFIIRAIDSINNSSNFSNRVCFDIDLCNPYYLPNIFSPNGDGANDLFTPFYPYEMVESVNMHIYNRWGALVFKTDNPDIMWDGTNQFNNLNCSAGVYYYACDVREYTLYGLRTRYLQGSITIVR